MKKTFYRSIALHLTLALSFSTISAPEHSSSSDAEFMAAAGMPAKFDQEALVFARKYLATTLPELDSKFQSSYKQLAGLVGDERDEAGKKLLFQILISINDAEKTLDYLKAIRTAAKVAGKLPPELKDEDTANKVLSTIATGIDTTLRYQGHSKKTAGKVKYESWPDMATRLHTSLDAKMGELTPAQGMAKLDDPQFWQLLDQEAQTQATEGNVQEIKVDGPAAFAKRDEMIANASRSIEIMTWSFEDDETGKRYADLLIEKAISGVDVKVMVDGQTSQLKGYGDQLKRMEANGVKVLRWMSTNPLRAFDGQHRKFTLVDGQEMIGGGMNYGDVYSHNRGQSKVKWRDTDVYAKGPATVQARNLFVKLWNAQLIRKENKGLPSMAMSEIKFPRNESVSGNLRVINQSPGENDAIMRSNLLLIKAAQKEINIENAYFINDPVMQKALANALERGVKVRILSNSMESIDVPEISGSISKSLNEMLALGAEVYVKKGDTLHTKSLQVDGKAGWIGSWNMHPRSQRLEGESIFLSRDPNFNKQQRSMFEADIKLNVATKITKPIDIKPSPIGNIFESFGFDLL